MRISEPLAMGEGVTFVGQQPCGHAPRLTDRRPCRAGRQRPGDEHGRVGPGPRQSQVTQVPRKLPSIDATFRLCWHCGTRHSATARPADRAVPVELMEFLAVMYILRSRVSSARGVPSYLKQV